MFKTITLINSTIRITYVESINIYKILIYSTGHDHFETWCFVLTFKTSMNEEISVGMYFQSRDFSIGLVFTKLVIYGAKEGRNRNMRIILVKDRLSHISKSIYVLYRKHSLLLNLPSLDICCFLLEFFTTTCFSHFSESKISMKSAVYLIRSYPFLCVQ